MESQDALKGQHIFLLLKLVSLQKQEAAQPPVLANPQWSDWEDPDEEKVLQQLGAMAGVKEGELRSRLYSLRAIEQTTGMPKSQVSRSLNHCREIGLLHEDRVHQLPRVNRVALYGLLRHAVRYLFPVRPGALSRGIATSLLAPEFHGLLHGGGELPLVWPDPYGKTKGQMIEPLYRTVPQAVRRDTELYALLALVDALRVGQPRECRLAEEQLAKRLEVKP